MCGIAGIVDFSRPGSAWGEPLRQVRARLRHRGPDGEGEAFGSFAALAHTRLAMVDVEGGAQPLRSEDGRYLLVYNGELYNHAELRAAVDSSGIGWRWRRRTDTETLLAAWALWGEACVPRLDGMFAFFIWDEQRQLGFAVRDPLGVKPLAYLDGAGPRFAFASEAQALLPLLPSAPRAHLDAVIEHLVAPIFSGVEASPFEGIRYLPPGHLLEVSRASLGLRAHFRFAPGACEEDDPARAAVAVREALSQAVRGALVSERPLGVFLSGGLDSTAVAALAREAGARLPAFTITFEGQEAWDGARSALVVSNDTPRAREAAAALGCPLREVRFERRTLEQELEELARVNDAIPAWEQELSQRALARAAAEEVRGVFVGDAADETHYGYHFLLDDVATSGPPAILARFGSIPIRADIDPDPATRLVGRYRALIEEAGGSFGTRRERILATTQLIVRRWLPRLLHNGDIHCMAFGLEPRVPFASAPLLEAATRVSPELGLRGGVEKWLLREALRGVVPESIRLRRKSALPKDQDVGESYQRVVRGVLAAPHPLVSRIVDVPSLAPLLQPRALSERERAQLFRVICLHHWATAHDVAAP
ncbi:MAG: asparagine synthase (glutamine-hydrolyzing) [Polyangiaceae bacterium]|nr:asparagine synthase (glutamine-hydrolyzing) [Polyangiaceae bacterium]